MQVPQVFQCEYNYEMQLVLFFDTKQMLYAVQATINMKHADVPKLQYLPFEAGS